MISIHPIFTNQILHKSQVAKACIQVLRYGAEEAPFYCGNYSTSKLLLSRLSWFVKNKPIPFSHLSVRSTYLATLSEDTQPVSAIEKWESKRYPIGHMWTQMIAYLHDKILNNKTKEKVYKIYTGAFPLGYTMNPVVRWCILRWRGK
jgi:hypothetical protein